MIIEKSALEEMFYMMGMGCEYEFTESTDGKPMIVVTTPKGYHRQFMYREEKPVK